MRESYRQLRSYYLGLLRESALRVKRMPEGPHKQHKVKMMQHGTWMIYFEDFARLLCDTHPRRNRGHTLALVLNHLMDRQLRNPGPERKNGGWYPTPITDMADCRLAGAKQQAAYLAVLEGDGLLQQVVRGFPAQRFVRLDFDRIVEILGRSPRGSNSKATAGAAE